MPLNAVVRNAGVFHGDALWNVKIRFSKDVAKRAEKVQFHPSQKISHGRNGSLVIEMQCRGHRELIWEMFHPDWIGHVKIESPEGLQKEYLGRFGSGKNSRLIGAKLGQTKNHENCDLEY